MRPAKKSGSLLLPRHNELSLFLIGAAMIALLVMDPVMRSEIKTAIAGRNLIATLPFCLLFFGQGLLFTIAHLFTESSKNAYEKFCMVFFAIFVNAVSGVAACIHMFREAGFSLLLAFPLWNLASAALLLGAVVLALMSGADLDHFEQRIGDEDATLAQLIIGTLSLAAIIAICRFGFQLHWSMTFSICVAYASNIERLFEGLVRKCRNPITTA